MWGRRSNEALWEKLNALATDFVTLQSKHDDLFVKHERLRAAFYQARQGLAANGEPIPLKQAKGETRDEFKARKLASLRGGVQLSPTTEE